MVLDANVMIELALPAGVVADAGVCGVCRMRPHEPTCAPSGYVFCARCVYPAVRELGRCPVSGLPADEAGLRRLYETSRPAGGGNPDDIPP